MLAEYLSYQMVSIILLIVKEFRKYVLKSTKNIFSPVIYLNMDSSFNVENKLQKYRVGSEIKEQ